MRSYLVSAFRRKPTIAVFFEDREVTRFCKDFNFTFIWPNGQRGMRNTFWLRGLSNGSTYVRGPH